MVAKVVLVTWCSTDIGRAVAQLMTAGGCTVVATARAVDSLDRVAAATSAPGRESGSPVGIAVAHLARRSRPKGAIPCWSSLHSDRGPDPGARARAPALPRPGRSGVLLRPIMAGRGRCSTATGAGLDGGRCCCFRDSRPGGVGRPRAVRLLAGVHSGGQHAVGSVADRVLELPPRLRSRPGRRPHRHRRNAPALGTAVPHRRVRKGPEPRADQPQARDNVSAA